MEEEKSQLESRLSGVTEKLNSATEEKITAELCVTDMKSNLDSAHEVRITCDWSGYLSNQ